MKKLFWMILFSASTLLGQEPISFLLGQELLGENSAEMAAIEFRRYALETEPATAQAQAYLHAAHAYLQAGQSNDAEAMLQQAEQRIHAHPALPVLHAEAAVLQNDLQAALYFLDAIPIQTNSTLAAFAARRSAELLLRSGKTVDAQDRLARSPFDEAQSLLALDAYAFAPKKSPAVGGWLGLIPGAGYWYSGEIANGFRSLLLNSLFIFGMAQTAQDDQWGAFAVISFFELTWYSGSIYGGVDAAHRYNRNQLEKCVDQLNVPQVESDPDVMVPLFQLKVLF